MIQKYLQTPATWQNSKPRKHRWHGQTQIILENGKDESNHMSDSLLCEVSMLHSSKYILIAEHQQSHLEMLREAWFWIY